jgi:S-adenosylmethionine:tRNA ribosyltransferase-isomerase
VKLDELQYDLPPERIAQYPAGARDASRLLVLNRRDGRCRHETFKALPELLPPRSLLVLNDTRVLPARLRLRRRSGGRIEGLFIQEPQAGTWEIMLAESRRLRTGESLLLEPGDQQLRLIERQEAGIWRARPEPPGDALELLARYGRPPLPPYIKRPNGAGGEAEGTTTGQGMDAPAKENRPGDKGTRRQGEPPGTGMEKVETSGAEAAEPAVSGPPARPPHPPSDAERYQTIYARRPGAIAAPTAGLHFTPEVFAALADAGVETAWVTLHVGVGTFAPIRTDDLADHVMHAEWYECPEATAAAVNAARAQGRPVAAVGTTSVRVLESCADAAGRVTAGSGWTRLFIYPPYSFKVVDVLLTNFHLPGSTLLAMIFAFAGRERTLAAYREAIEGGYRFYSYGDAMLIL